VCRDEGNYALFDFVEGGFQYCRYVLFPGQARHFITVAGELLAILHTKLQGCVPQGYNPNGFKSQKGDRWRELEWYVGRLTYCVAEASRPNGVAHREQGARLLTQAGHVEALMVQLDAMLKEAGLPRLIAHGDYGPYNLLFRKNAPVVILDFEIAHLDWRVFDLVDAWWRFCNNRFLGLSINKMICLLDAYQSRLPLTEDELRLMPEVWKYLHVRRCIKSWYKYCQTQADFRLARARQHLKLVDWMIVNQDDLMAAVG
jgi:Ser/Thr protein kinase RdoA (MazF antagonist)